MNPIHVDQRRKRTNSMWSQQRRSSTSFLARSSVCCTLSILLLLLPTPTRALQLFPKRPSSTIRASSQLPVYPLDQAEQEDLTLTKSDDNFGEWSAMSSWGAALLQLRKEEEEIMREIADSPSSTGTSSSSTTAAAVAVATKSKSKQKDDDLALPDDEQKGEKIPEDIEAAEEVIRPPEAHELMQMDVETAKELDGSVTRRGLSPSDIKEDMTVLPMSPYYTSQLTRTASDGVEPVSDMPLSRPEHYSDRIDRDKRLLAIGISESVDEAWQWRRFGEEKGGIKSLLTTIQTGAKFVQQQPSFELFPDMIDEYEETFLAACSACRALRDLCTISDDVRAVMTDEILRANAAAGGDTNSLIKDFCSLLRHADEAEILYGRLYKFRPKSNLFRLMGRKNRRGESQRTTY
jgi:hypothetical protein